MIQALISLILLVVTFGNYYWLSGGSPVWVNIALQSVTVVIAIANVLSYHGPKTTFIYDNWARGWNLRRGLQMIALLGSGVVLVVMIMFALGRIAAL
ncbi:MAG TPA: hypothetical protein VGM95_01840 [Lactobacillaceae bacterium]